jgi:hypothetical protein
VVRKARLARTSTLIDAEIVNAVVLAAVLEADLGRHRKILRFRLLRPILIAAAIVPLFLEKVTTHGGGLTVGLWIALIAAKLILIAIASAADASAGGGTSSLLLTLGVSLLAEAAIVSPRARSTGLPFATGRRDSEGGRSGSPVPPGNAAEQAGAGQCRSPGLSDGVRWLRQRTSRPGNQDWSQEVPSRGPAGDDDYSYHHHHHHDHHDHHHDHHGLTGPS